MMSLMRELFHESQMKNPIPTPPISISPATIASHESPTPIHKPVKMNGAAAGNMIEMKYSPRFSRSTFATFW